MFVSQGTMLHRFAQSVATWWCPTKGTFMRPPGPESNVSGPRGLVGSVINQPQPPSAFGSRCTPIPMVQPWLVKRMEQWKSRGTVGLPLMRRPTPCRTPGTRLGSAGRRSRSTRRPEEFPGLTPELFELTNQTTRNFHVHLYNVVLNRQST